ncbi:MAG TPA: response regulator [Gemmatimonadales bacterium]|nr:response regulator [Gemmatimonadales bacterium]
MSGPDSAIALVLLAEDDRDVCSLLARGLREDGYAVLTAHDGAAALAVLESLVSPADVLVTDVTMPRLRGDRLALLALARGLARHVLFITGGAVHAADVPISGPILPKPLSPATLSQAVAKVLVGA